MHPVYARYLTLVLIVAANSVAWADDLRAEMETANAEWLAAYNAFDGAALGTMYTPDAILLAPGQKPIVGAEAIGKWWAEGLASRDIRNHTFEIVSVERGGPYAYQVARWTLDVVNDRGEIKKKTGNTVRVLERQKNGKWLTKVLL